MCTHLALCSTLTKEAAQSQAQVSVAVVETPSAAAAAAAAAWQQNERRGPAQVREGGPVVDLVAKKMRGPLRQKKK